MVKVGICFGGYCPMHQGHLDIIMRAKKENDICFVIVCGFDGEERGESIGLPLRRRVSLVRRLFRGDEQIKVLEINDTELGIDESMSENNWLMWTSKVWELISKHFWLPTLAQVDVNSYTWYVAEPFYKESLDGIMQKFLPGACDIMNPRFSSVELMDRLNPISGTEIRENPLKFWNKIAWTFRPYFSTNILITGTASEGKSTLTRDIATYFGIPYSEEFGRTYMAEMCKTDIDLTINDFREFLIGQLRDTKQKIEGPGNTGIVISDTDNMVTLMYAQAYVEDENIDLTWEDYKVLEALAKNIQRGITWDKIFLLPPKNTFVDDGTRYMAQSSMVERGKNYMKLVKLLKKFGWWDKVEILNGTYYENFNRVKDYVNSKYNF